MEKEQPNTKNLIIETLLEKTKIKQKAHLNTLEAFNSFKATMQQFTIDYNSVLNYKTNDQLIDYKDKGVFEAEMRVGEDLIMINMHTNVFDFDKSHYIWKTSYLQKDPLASFCGTINIYNFLNDSFKYNRMNDIGYLIARIFINKDKHYFVEGKRQLGFLYNDFVNSTINKEDISKILESAILFSLDFDLLVPEYENVNMISVLQMKENINQSKIQTAKRLGFKFNADTNIIE